MSVENINGKEIDFEAAVNLMDGEIRESIAAEGIEDEQEFIERYAEAHEAKHGEGFAPYVGCAW